MLSYRHSYHAGNHADVIKHITLIAVLDYMIEKDKPITYIDTHSSQGLYSLESQHSSKNQEHLEGVSKLEKNTLPLMQRYTEFLNGQWYSGSVDIAQQILRSEDKLRCFELHPNDFKALYDHTRGDRRVRTFNEDGYKGLLSQLPPQTKRSVTFIDPSYELESDYHAVISALNGALQRFAVGVYVVWYPLLSKIEIQRFQKQLEKLAVQGKGIEYLHCKFQVRKPGPGMYGSGMFVINPPWTLKEQMEAILPILCQQIGDSNASFEITAKLS